MGSFSSAPQSIQTRNKELLIAIGRRAFINAARSERVGEQNVPLNDEQGHPLPNDLRDGEEVEILAWNPRSLGGLTYQVRRVADGQEWWVRPLYLRVESAAP